MSPLHPTTALPVDALVALAEVVDHALGADDRPLPTLLRARILGDEIELGWRPLASGRHPVDELLCFTAPTDWCALGIAAPGRATLLDEPDRAPVAVHTVHLVGRDGAWASRWGRVGEAAASAGDADDRRRPVGRVDDVCRRALGLPTDAPPASTSLLWALQWLDTVVDVALRTSCSPAVASWDAVALRHPAVLALQADVRDGSPSPDALAELARQLSTWRDWPALRRSCAAGSWEAATLPPEVAGWLDDGAFARWVLGGYPELDDLRAAVADLLPPGVATAVETTLAASGVVRG